MTIGAYNADGKATFKFDPSFVPGSSPVAI